MARKFYLLFFDTPIQLGEAAYSSVVLCEEHAKEYRAKAQVCLDADQSLCLRASGAYCLLCELQKRGDLS